MRSTQLSVIVPQLGQVGPLLIGLESLGLIHGVLLGLCSLFGRSIHYMYVLENAHAFVGGLELWCFVIATSVSYCPVREFQC